MEYDYIEMALQKELNALAEKGGKFFYDTEWTVDLKQRLFMLGTEMEFEVRTTNKKSEEWLYDVVWLVRGNDGTINNVVLVLESEWKQNAEEYDFDKLLLARAKHRAMVFTGKKRENYQGSIDRLKERIQKFVETNKGDRYFFAAWANSKRQFIYDLYIAPDESPSRK